MYGLRPHLLCRNLCTLSAFLNGLAVHLGQKKKKKLLYTSFILYINACVFLQKSSLYKAIILFSRWGLPQTQAPTLCHKQQNDDNSAREWNWTCQAWETRWPLVQPLQSSGLSTLEDRNQMACKDMGTCMLLKHRWQTSLDWTLRHLDPRYKGHGAMQQLVSLVQLLPETRYRQTWYLLARFPWVSMAWWSTSASSLEWPLSAESKNKFIHHQHI